MTEPPKSIAQIANGLLREGPSAIIQIGAPQRERTARARRIAAPKSRIRYGFIKISLTPNFLASAGEIGSEYPDVNTIGMPGRSSRTRTANSTPFMPGIVTSEMIKS